MSLGPEGIVPLTGLRRLRLGMIRTIQKRARRDTRTIQQLAKVVSGGARMSIGDPPKHCPSPESMVPAGPPSGADESYGSLLGLCRAVSKYGSPLSFTKLLPVELTF